MKIPAQSSISRLSHPYSGGWSTVPHRQAPAWAADCVGITRGASPASSNIQPYLDASANTRLIESHPYAGAWSTAPHQQAPAWTADCAGITRQASPVSSNIQPYLGPSASTQLTEGPGFHPDSGQIKLSQSVGAPSFEAEAPPAPGNGSVSAWEANCIRVSAAPSQAIIDMPIDLNRLSNSGLIEWLGFAPGSEQAKPERRTEQGASGNTQASSVRRRRAPPIPVDKVKTLCELGPEKIEKLGGLRGVAKKYNIAYTTVQKYILVDGTPGPLANDRLNPHEKVVVTNDLLREWETLSAAQIEDMGGLIGVAEKYNVKYGDVKEHVSATGGLSQVGMDRLYPDMRNPVTDAMVIAWSELNAAQIKDKGGIYGIAREYNVKVSTLRHLLSLTGLKKPGQTRLANALERQKANVA